MKYLLDTQVLLWYAMGNKRLKGVVLCEISEGPSRLCVSIASLWELAIKESLGKLELEGDYSTWATRNVLEQAFDLIPIHPDHLVVLNRLPWHHRDPFDRLLIAQALSAGLCVVTGDSVFKQYEELDLREI